MFYSSNSEFEEKVAVKAAEFCEQVISEMGAEIHDDLIQKLSSISYSIERLERSSQDPAEVLRLVSTMRAEFEHVKQSVRSISRRLHPVHQTDASFHQILLELCDNMQRPGSGLITCTSSGTEKQLPGNVLTHLYRIVQELLHNAFKHSSAWRAEVRVLWSPLELVIEVEDDGTNPGVASIVNTAQQRKRSTLTMRSQAINASINYQRGKKGLLAQVRYRLR